MAFDDEFGYHEVLDRTHLLVSLLNDHLMSHPAIAEDDDLTGQAVKAEAEIVELYQMIGRKSHEKFGGREEKPVRKDYLRKLVKAVREEMERDPDMVQAKEDHGVEVLTSRWTDVCLLCNVVEADILEEGR